MKFKKTEKDEESEDNIGEENDKKEEETISNNTFSIEISDTSETEKNKTDYKKVKNIKKNKEDNSHINMKKKEKKIAFEIIKKIEEIISFCYKKKYFWFISPMIFGNIFYIIIKIRHKII